MRVKGLDTLRFICALIVLIGHVGFDFKDTLGLGVFGAILNNSFVGVAAVVVFFIISGFCIHLPYSTGRKLNNTEFILKRITRIAIPAIIAVVGFFYLTGNMLGVIWSLVCEVIYYLLYPVLWLLIKDFKSIKSHFIVLFSLLLLSLLVSVYYDFSSVVYNGDFHRTGYWLTFIVGYPMWYMGVILAELFTKEKGFSYLSIPKVWLLRFSVFGASIICSIARFHLNISYAYSFLIFSLLAMIWVYAELWYFRTKKENKWIELGGMASYSIYIVHMSVFVIYYKFVNHDNFQLFDVGLIVSISLLCSYLFFRVIEKPSHKLAQSIKFKPAVHIKKNKELA